MIEQLDKTSTEGDLFFVLQRIHTWIKLGNKGLARNLIKDVITKSPQHWNFSSVGQFLTEEEKIVIKQNSLIHITSIKDQLEQDYIEVLLLYLEQFISREYFAQLSSVKGVDYSANKIRLMANRYYFGVEYPSIWFPQLLKRFRSTEAYQYLNTSFEKLEQKEMQQYIWLLAFHFPQNEKTRDMTKLFIEDAIKNENNFVNYDYMISLLENKSIHGFIREKNIQLLPLFSYKKKHYVNCLKQQHSFNLFGLCLLELSHIGMDNLESVFEKL